MDLDRLITQYFYISIGSFTSYDNVVLYKISEDITITEKELAVFVYTILKIHEEKI